MNNKLTKRCGWPANDPDMLRYHDTEWGVPLHNDNLLFEFLILEGAQAGLSWSTILKRRQNYRIAFDYFEPAKVAEYGKTKAHRLLADNGIIRNRLKIKSAIQNAQAFVKIQLEFGSFDKYIWQFVNGKPIKNKWERLDQIPAKTAQSDSMSVDLKKRGFSFVGSTICYAHMQATGMVNDHLISCFRYKQCQ